ncbi:MAG: hypothetical protein AAF919_03070 [Pseudomonadota bacterium]
MSETAVAMPDVAQATRCADDPQMAGQARTFARPVEDGHPSATPTRSEETLIARHGSRCAARMIARHETWMGWHDWHVLQAEYGKARTCRLRAMAALQTPPRHPVFAWLAAGGLIGMATTLIAMI